MKSSKTPESWKRVKLVEPRRGRYSIVTEFLGSPFGPSIRAAMCRPLDESSDRLTLNLALERGEFYEKFLEQQEPQAKKARKR